MNDSPGIAPHDGTVQAHRAGKTSSSACQSEKTVRAGGNIPYSQNAIKTVTAVAQSASGTGEDEAGGIGGIIGSHPTANTTVLTDVCQIVHGDKTGGADGRDTCVGAKPLPRLISSANLGDVDHSGAILDDTPGGASSVVVANLKSGCGPTAIGNGAVVVEFADCVASADAIEVQGGTLADRGDHIVAAETTTAGKFHGAFQDGCGACLGVHSREDQGARAGLGQTARGATRQDGIQGQGV